jgi:dihydroxyacetone kinase-like protein
MHSFQREDLPYLFALLRDVFAREREALIELDSKVGDSDLGITMNRAFTAAWESVNSNANGAISKTLQIAGVAVAKAAPSTMGTLVATGLMRGGKALEGCVEWATPQMAAFWEAFYQGVAERGKAQLGDKTLLDVLAPIVRELGVASNANAALDTALQAASEAAAQGLEATKNMISQHGKAACFQEKTLGLQDAGATVGWLMIQTMHHFSIQKNRNIP